MTSNIGSRQLKDFGQGVGFSTTAKSEGIDVHTKSVIEGALKKAFAPEFLNRIDDVVLFNSLSKEHIFEIIDLELEKLYSRITDLGYKVTLTAKAKNFIAEKGFDRDFGARPLKRAIQRYMEDPLAEEIINSNLEEGDSVKVDFDEEKKDIVVSVKKKSKSSSKKSKEDPAESNQKE